RRPRAGPVARSGRARARAVRLALPTLSLGGGGAENPRNRFVRRRRPGDYDYQRAGAFAARALALDSIAASGIADHQESTMTRFIVAVATFTLIAPARAADPIKVGIIGLDTSHVTAFTKDLNDPNAKPDLIGFR